MDIEQFRRNAARKKKTLLAFLNKLDEIVPEDMDDLVARTDQEVWKEIKCTECAHCCKTMTPIFLPEDMTRISKHLGITVAQLKKQYITKEKDSGKWVISEHPCKFLVDNKCSIYEVRPLDCAEFPHHDKKPFDEYVDTFKGNIMHCPATLLLVEKLKKNVEQNYEW
jgi:Fe-S-cluster containining protein